ncbi:MAG: hypothetical protein IKZ59_07125 [Clostridia bacterium]|nr:hypothetical protein [Clostridia bacterium]
MSDKKKVDSDTLSQQRKAREEFLELKRIQSGEISAPPPPSAEAVEPKTAEEKAKNFWYYYRWAVLAVVFIAIIIAICVKQCVSKIKYDVRVVVYTSSPVSDEDCGRMEKYFEKYCDDVNGNGSVDVQVINCSYSEKGNRNTIITNNTKVQSIIAAEYDVVLFITDKNTYDYLNSISNTGELLEKNCSIQLDDEFYKECDGDSDDLFEIPKDLTVSRRIIDGTTFEKNKKAVTHYKAAGEMIEKMKKK